VDAAPSTGVDAADDPSGGPDDELGRDVRSDRRTFLERRRARRVEHTGRAVGLPVGRRSEGQAGCASKTPGIRPVRTSRAYQ
jgi:hypothetical protein